MALSDSRQADAQTNREFDHEAWIELTRMIVEYEDGYEPAGAFARRLLSWWRSREHGGC